MATNGQDKEEARARTGVEKFYCLTCGKPIGRAVPGNVNAGYCDRCKNEYTLDFREAGGTLKHSAYRLIPG